MNSTRSNSRLIFHTLIIALTLLLGSANSAYAGRNDQSYIDPNIMKEMLPKVSYSADRIMTVQGQSMNSKVHYTPQMERNELSIGGFTAVTVTRYDKELIWSTTPMGGVSEIKFSDQKSTRNSTDPEGKLEQAGTDTVDGQKVKVYVYTRVDSDGSRIDGKFFLTEDNIPLRNEITFTERKGKNPMQMVMQLRNVQIGTQPASLFEKPQSAGMFGGMKNLFKKH